MKIWNIVIAENHPIFREGMKLILDNVIDFNIVGDATTGQHAIRICKELNPDVLLLDINMPNGNGIEVTEILKHERPEIIIIAVSGYLHEDVQREILRAGASGYISKEAEYDDIITQIKRILKGVNSASLIKKPTKFGITTTEFKVLTLLAEGHSRPDIADQLTISINTVKMHFRNLYQKLGVKTAKDAIRVAIENNLLS